MYSKELLKGTLSVIILKLLGEHQRMYGYQIAQMIKELSDNKILVREGSLYPALHKLKEDDLVKIETENIGKRVRHYYVLTQKGEIERKEREAEILDFIITIQKIIKNEKINQPTN